MSGSTMAMNTAEVACNSYSFSPLDEPDAEDIMSCASPTFSDYEVEYVGLDDPDDINAEEGDHNDAIGTIANAVTRCHPLRTDPRNITARDVETHGMDPQGIPWQGLLTTRSAYRARRVAEYQNYENIGADHSGIQKELDACPVQSDGKFFRFKHNTRDMRATIVHFQLRNLVWSTSCHDAYVIHDACISHWNSQTKKATPVVNLSDLQGSSSVSTLCVHPSGVAFAGGFYGDVIALNVRTGQVASNVKVSTKDNAIVNAIQLNDRCTQSMQCIISNNDNHLRLLDVETMKLTAEYEFDFAVNHTTVSPDGKLHLVVGDSTNCLLTDASNGRTIAQLEGHVDYSFASGWSPQDYLFATGNQDTTCRLWDLRYLKKSVSVLGGHMGSVRSLRFSNDGRFLAFGEPADFVHVYDVASGCKRVQEIDLFGEVAGISFSPDGQSLFVGVHDRTYGSLMEFTRQGRGAFQDSLRM